MKWIVAICLLLAVNLVVAQGGYGRKKKDAFPPQPQYEKSHWYFAPGFTQNIWFGDQEKQINPNTIDTRQHKGGFGYYGEFGRYTILNNLYFFRYLNYGLALKSFKGSSQIERTVEGPTTVTTPGQSTWNKHMVDLHFEMSNATKLSDNAFIQNSFGIVGSFAFINNESSTLYPAGGGITDRISANLTYKLGFGYKVSRSFIAVPSIQTSPLRVFPFSPLTVGMRPIETQSMPLVVSLRIILLRKYRPPNCKPVDVIGLPEGFDPENQTQ